ncbi:MAG: thermonuclease family protein [Magnetospiraceae bacterium]
MFSRLWSWLAPRLLLIWAIVVFLLVIYGTVAKADDAARRAVVVSITDGDTIQVTAEAWPGMYYHGPVRLRGVDTPELRGKCASEKRAARLAAFALETLILGKDVLLTDIAEDKYGRVLARVWIDGRDAAEILVMHEFGRPYAGGRRKGWCHG